MDPSLDQYYRDVTNNMLSDHLRVLCHAFQLKEAHSWINSKSEVIASLQNDLGQTSLKVSVSEDVFQLEFA